MLFLLLYAALFWAVTWKRPAWALMMIFASAPFQNDLSGAGPVKFSLAELSLVLTIPYLFLRNRPLRIGPISWGVAFFLLVSCFASVSNWRSTTTVSIAQMILYFIGAVAVFSSLARRDEDFQLALVGIVVIGIFFSVMGLLTSFLFLGHNKNGIGASLACALLVSTELWFAATDATRRRLLMAAMVIIAVGLVSSLSRGAWLGTICGLLLLMAMRRQFGLVLRFALVLLPLIASTWSYLPQQSREYAVAFDASRWNIKMRYKSIDFARSKYEQNPLYGTGVGLRKEYDATNVVWVTLAETGVLGLIGLVVIHILFLRMIWTTQKFLLRTDPRYSLLAIGGVLVVNKVAHGLVDHYWSRGAIMMAWAGAGMATYAYFSVRREISVARAMRQQQERAQRQQWRPAPVFAPPMARPPVASIGER